MIFAANFKMNHTRASTRTYMIELAKQMKYKKAEDRVIVFPPATALDSYDGDFAVGAQDAYTATSGAYTGEIGVEQLKEFGINSILVGHSERREILRETQEVVATKFQFFKTQGFEIIYCIGEPLEVREQGHDAVMEYLLAQFDGVDIEYDNSIIAYEPIWAIGSGRSANADEISSTHSAIKAAINRPLLYGGSVKPDNIKEIIGIKDVDGVLVGGASLKVNSFMELVRCAC
ncbi:MAG: triose-phosphate isomerase [Sulfurovum sp.]|nr:triose-phosphate isomerase [Sulfurovum sp.]